VRPLRIAMQAFGPYKKREVVDFSRLGSNRLFLVHGETGAGKTSILDAMVFALYGDTSGGERQGSQMRCESADPTSPTEVVFDFALGGREFRVTRRPKQELAAQRGKRLVPKQAEAGLWETTGVAPGSEGRLLGSKIRDVDEAVRGLLGFSSEQFRQVVLLPQGKFRDLLSAGSDKREEILRQLFRTDHCAALERALAERAKDVVRQQQELQMERRIHLETVGAASNAELEALAEEAAEAVEAAARDEAIAEEVSLWAAAAVEEAGKSVAALADVVAAAARIEDLQKEQPRIDELKEAVVRAKEAERLAPCLEAARVASEVAAQAEVDEAAAQKALLQALAASAEAAGALRAAEARGCERSAASERLQLLLDIQGKVSGWLIAEEAKTEAERTLRDAQAALQTAGEAAASAKREVEEARSLAAEIKSAAAALPAAKDGAGRARQTLAQCGRRDETAASLEAARDGCARTVVTLRRAEADLREAERQSTSLESLWRAGRAAALAQQLVPGAPCPVCGSREHPAPARGADAAATVVDDERLDRARESLQRLRDTWDAAQRAHADAEKEETKAAAELRALQGTLPEGLTMAAAQLDLQQRVLDLRSLQRTVAGDTDPDRLVSIAQEQLAEAERGQAAARVAERDAATALASRAATAQEVGKGIPEELRAPVALQAALREARSLVEQLGKVLEDARAAVKQADEETAGSRRHLEAMQTARAKAQKAAQEAFANRDETLGHSTFPDADTCRGALMSQEALLESERQISAHRDSLQEATGRLKQAEDLLKRHPAAGDIESLRLAAQAAVARLKEAQNRLHSAQSRQESLKKVKEDIQNLDERFREVADRYAVVGRLAEVAQGQGGGAKVSFQRWVLGAYLDDVLASATRRLTAMSKGRYRLERQRESTDLRRAGGLDVAVYDAWSNRSRSAVTLSGGEGFLAALSLALGLAQTVQEYAGGTRLDTIFVDEGFGGLDQDALDLATEALMELKDSGRLVGVITHVPELRQVIDARLEVHGGPAGSWTRFVVP